jgi:hypothetical protein
MSDKQPKSPATLTLDPSVLGAARDAAHTLSVDPKTLSLAGDAARDFARVTSIIEPKAMRTVTEAIKSVTAMDSGAVASVAATLHGFDTSKFVASGAITEAARAFEAARPVVAPQIAQALRGIDMRIAPSFAAAVTGVDSSGAFKFAKAIGAVDMASMMTGGITQSIKGLDLSGMFGSHVAEALRVLPTTFPRDLVPTFEEAAKEAVALAETRGIAEPIDESLGALEGLTPAKRRKIASQVLLVIAGFLGLAGLFANHGDMKATGACLGCAVALIRLYWMLTDKDE